MPIEEFLKLYEYLMENHSWKNMFEITCEQEKRVRIFKYIRFSVDTRDGNVWCVTFSGGGDKGHTFRLDVKEDVDAMYKFLDEDLSVE